MIYVIVPSSIVASEHLKGAVGQRVARKSVDGCLCVLKFKGDVPDSLTRYKRYSAHDIARKLASRRWGHSKQPWWGFLIWWR